MNGRSAQRGRFTRTAKPWRAAALALTCLLAAGCEDFDPLGIEPPDPDDPEPSEPVGPPSRLPKKHPSAPPKPPKPPEPQYPMGLDLRDLETWVFSPDRTAMFPERERNTVIRDFDAGSVLRLTAEGQACAWSPDSRWLLYWNRGWCVVSRSGKTNRRVTSQEGAGTSDPQWAGNLPVWHPAGPSLLLLDGHGRFRLVAVTGERDRQVATTDRIPVRHRSAAPDFFVGPGGEWLFYVDRDRVGFLKSDGTRHSAGRRAIRDCDPPQWSADGTAVLVMAQAPDSKGHYRKQAWRIGLPTGEIQPVCRADPVLRDAGRYVLAFAPEGYRAAYVAADRDQPRIVLVDARNHHLTKIHNEREAESLRFSPDGRALAYVSDGEKNLVILDLDEPRGVRIDFAPLFDRGNPVIEGWTDDGRALRVWTAARTLWHVNVGDGTVRRLWPDTWMGPGRRSEFKTAHVPLEEENLVPPQGPFEAVPEATADLEPDLQKLPVQMVPEEPSEP
ncbi:MAG: hypothetical protein R6X20_17215 [Phycisphaerae bacterium]